MSATSSGRRLVTKLHSEWILPPRKPSAAAMTTDPTTAANSNNATTSPPAHTIAFLHGLLGNGRNVKTMARNLVKQHHELYPHSTRGLLLDVRGHGKSQLPMTDTATTTFADCVRDVQETLLHLHASEFNSTNTDNQASSSTTDSESPPTLISLVGHSLGGRLSLQYAYEQLDPIPHEVWLLDTVPGGMNQQVMDIVQKLHDFSKEYTLNRPKESTPNDQDGKVRNDERTLVARRLYQDYGIDQATSQWLASAFQPSHNEEGQCFEFDLRVIDDLIQDFDKQDFVHQLETILQVNDDDDAGRPTTRIDLVCAGNNPAWQAPENKPVVDYLKYELVPRHEPHFQIHVVPKAGHWVHIDNLSGLLQVMARPL